MSIHFEYKSKKFNEESLTKAIWKRFRQEVGSIYGGTNMYIDTERGGFRWYISPDGEELVMYINPDGCYSPSSYETGPYLFNTIDEMCDCIEGKGYKNRDKLIGMKIKSPYYYKKPESFWERLFPNHWNEGEEREMTVESVKCLCRCVHTYGGDDDSAAGCTWQVISLME